MFRIITELSLSVALAASTPEDTVLTPNSCESSGCTSSSNLSVRDELDKLL